MIRYRILAADAANAAASIAENFDPWNVALNFGLLGVFVYILMKGGWVVLARELKALEKAHAEKLAVKDELLKDRAAQISQVRKERDAALEQVEERERFIREAVVRSNVEVMERSMELIRHQVEGLTAARDRRPRDEQ